MNHIESGFRRLVAYTVGGVAVLAFVLFLRALFMTQSQPTTGDSPIPTPENELPLTSDPFEATFFVEEGDDSEPAWSPDGRYIAYTSLRGNTSYLFVRDLTTNSITQIATDAWYPRWSPDGAQLLYERSRPDGNRDTYLTDPQGAQHVKINDTPDAGGAIWSPDGQSILLSTRSGELHVVSRDGASARVMPVENIWALSLGSVSPDGTQVIGSAATRDSQGLTGLIRIDAQTGRISQQIVNDPLAGSAVLSPDGKTVAYRTSDKDNTAVGIVRAVPASGGEPHTLATPRPGYSVSQYAWSPDSRFIAYVDYLLSSVMDGGEVFVVRADGSQPVPLLPGSVVRTFSWSPDGTQIAISVKNGGQFDIAIIRADEASLLARQAALEAKPKPANVFTIQRLTTDPDSEYRLAISPDGQSVAFERAPAGSFFGWDIYSMNLATGETRRLTDSPEGEMSPAWSPDGTRIAYQRMTSTPSGLAAVDWLVINADGSAPVIVSSGAAWSGEEPAAWSPDSNRIAFMDGGSIVVFSLGGPREVARFVPPTDRWFSTPVWLPDGKRVVFAGGDALMIGDVETGEFVPVASTAGFARLPMWSNALSRLAYFDVSDRMDVRLISLNADGSDPLTLARFTSPTLQYPAWSHDGRFIAYLAEDSLRVTVAWTDQYIDRPPLFTLPLPSILVNGPPGTVDLRGVSWLPGTSSFVFVDSRDGQPDLYLATLNEEALRAYLDVAPIATPTSFPTAPVFDSTPHPFPTPFPTPTPFQNFDFYWPSRLTNDPTGNYRPAISPDGRSVAFAGERDGNWDIYVLDFASSAETRLTDDPLNDMAPSWSPDGSRIAYQHNVPSSAGPVLVDHVVMNADGSDKKVVASGAVWIGNEAPAWSPSGDRIAFSDGKGVTVVSVADQRKVVFTPPEASAYFSPAWIDDNQVVFTHDGALSIGDVTSGAVTLVPGAQTFARLPMTTPAFSRIAYFALNGSAQLITTLPNGGGIAQLAQFSGNVIQHAAWSPDGRFIAYYVDDSIQVSIAWTNQFETDAPLFAISSVTTGLSDLVSMAWLPDSSGFVYVAATDGQPDLYLATLNRQAIQAYVDYYPQYAPGQGPLPTPPPPPTPTPWATPPPPGEWPTPFPTPVATIPSGVPPYWLQLVRHLGGTQVAVAGQYVWLVDENDNGLFAYDAGATWSSFTLPPATQHFAVWPRFDGTDLFAATADGIYRSAVEGLGWQSILAGGPYVGVTVSANGTLFAAEQLTCRVHRSTDGGATWIASTVSASGCKLARVVVSPHTADGRVVYALTQLQGLWLSIDQGTTWQAIGGEYWFDAVVDPVDPALVYAANGATLARFDTSGGARDATFPIPFATALAVGPDQTVYVGSIDGRVYASRDQGATWSEISTFSGDPIVDIVAADKVVYVLTERSLLGGFWEGAPVPATPTGAQPPTTPTPTP